MSQGQIDSGRHRDQLICQAREPWGTGERATASIIVGLLAWSLAALACALLGILQWWTVLPIGLGTWVLMRRALPRKIEGGGLDKWWVAAIGLALAVVVFNAFFPSEHLLTGRDSGTYVATAGWLAETGGLFIDAEVEAFEDFGQLEFAVPGFYQRGGMEALEPQFMHAYPAMLASLIDVVGIETALSLNAGLAGVLLLAVFALGRRLMRAPAALLAMGTLVVSLVFIYYARAPFTEVLMATFALAGIWLLLVAEPSNDKQLGFLAGALIGATTVVRLDGIVLLVPVTAYLVFRARIRPDLGRVLRSARRGLFVVALVGLAESLWVSPAYVLDRSSQVAPVLVVVLLLLVLSEIKGRPLQRVTDLYRENRHFVFGVIVTLSAVLLAYAWVVRPALVEVPGDTYGLEAIQEREGLEVDPNRSYAEQSVRWVTWYQGGFFMILGFIGCSLLLRRSMFEIDRGSDSLLVLVLATFAVLYFWRPSINPDHIWVMRRYMTVVLPFGAVGAAFAIDRAIAMVSNKFGRGFSHGTAIVLAGMLLIPPTVISAPSWDLAEFDGLAEDFVAACDAIGSESHVLIVSRSLGHALAQGFRSYCGVPTAYVEVALTQADLGALTESVQDEGSRLVVVTPQSDGSLFRGSYEFLLQTLSHPPTERANVGLDVGIVG